MSAEPLLHQQHIGQVSASYGAQNAVGVFYGNVQFGNTAHPQKTLEQATSVCRDALRFTDPYVDREKYTSAKGTRVAGTCEWITQNESYQSWLHGDTRLLWISGGAGMGKTMMSIFLTEELERTALNDTRLIFYFCSHRRDTATTVLRSLVDQIVTKRPELAMHILPYFETPKRARQTLSSLETLWIIFTRLVKDPEIATMFCVLDGLDECDDNSLRVLVPRIVNLFCPKNSLSITTAFRLVILSRDIPVLQSCTTVKLYPDNNKKMTSDIERFVSARVDELSRIDGFDGELRAIVQTALLARAEGTFLWVGFAMNELLRKQTCSEVIETLSELPRDLPAIYSRMLLQIPSRRKRTSSMILRWVTMAWRPLQLEELAAAIGIQSSSSAITAERAIRDEIALCGPLLKVQEGEVSLIHQSARDYLLRKERDSNPVLEAFRIEQGIAHLELARTCLDCVTQSGLQNASLDFDIGTFSHESSLLHYSMFYWPEHARSCSALAVELFNHSEGFFQPNSIVRKHWWTTYVQADELLRTMAPFNPTSMLQIACYFGIVPWVQAILDKKRRKLWLRKPWDQEDQDEKIALFVTVMQEHEAVLQVLVSRGVSLNVKEDSGWTALQAAISDGNEAVVLTLVNGGADFKGRNPVGRMPLYDAALNGHKAVVQVLIDNGADVNANDSEGQKALHKAVWQGYYTVVQMLFKRGADVKAKNNSRLTALHGAALRGHEAIVRILVGSKADVMIQDNDGERALHKAAHGGHETIVQLLAHCGADIDARDKLGQTALIVAAFRGHEAVVKRLANSGAVVRAKDNNGQTALHMAAYWGRNAVVQLLIRMGADVEAKDKYGLTALHLAALWGEENETLVQMLIDSGADVEARGHNGMTVLHLAASVVSWKSVSKEFDRSKRAAIETKKDNKQTPPHSAPWRATGDSLIWAKQEGLSGANSITSSLCEQVEVVKALLDFGANIEAKDDGRRTPLHMAAARGHRAVVQILVERGAEVNGKDIFGWTALHFAALKGQNAVVQFLVRSKADVEAKDTNSMTVLHIAVIGGHEVVVGILAECGADVNTRDRLGRTALNDAVLKKNKKLVKVLLDNKADVMARVDKEQTALHEAALFGQDAMVQLLVKSGVDVEATNSDGLTALHFAVQEGHKAVVQALVDNGADVKAKCMHGWTVLHVVALVGHKAVAQLLIDSGADVEVQGDNGWTALHIAALNGHRAVVQLLIGSGADVGVQADNGRTALRLAVSQGHKAVVWLLMRRIIMTKALCILQLCRSIRSGYGCHSFSSSATFDASWRYRALFRCILNI